MQQFHNIRFHLIVALSILFGCLAPQPSRALPLNPEDGIKAAVSLGGHLAVFHDAAGTLTIQDITSGRSDIRFVPIPSMLTQGYRKGAIWVRFSLSAPSTVRQWLLQVERPLIEQATLYMSDGAGSFAVAAPGLQHAWAGEGAGAYPTIFPISVPPAPAEYYLRLQSSTSITTSLNIWQRDGYEAYRRADVWLMGIVIGAVGAMILANLLYAARLREILYILYAWLLVNSALITIFHMGYSSEVLQFLGPERIRYSWGIIVCLYSIVVMLFLDRLFEFRIHWTWAHRLSQGVVLLNGVALVLTTMGRYGDVGLFVSRLQQFSVIFVALFVCYLLMVKRQYQYVLSAIAFMSVIAVLLVMQVQYTGANPLGLDSSLARLMAVGTLIHLGLLSAAVAKRAHLAERNLSEEKDRVIAISQSVEHELTTKVRERTAELSESNASLKAEMDRRHLLEVKLRQSLDSVNDALAQQRDFLALVSHEFRGPLAVIAAAADNLSISATEAPDNIKLRTGKIRRTVKRMSMLIENVLAGDRLDADTSHAVIGTFDLNEILQIAQAGLDDDAAGRVDFVPGDEVMVKGDRYLLEIALQNLIQNALKYSPATSPVTVRLSVDQGVALVDVTDRGVGVPPEDRAFIFLKYYRVAGRRAKGSGLGLYISREIARQHGGNLILAASDAGGSTFRLSLPIESPRVNNSQSDRSQSPANLSPEMPLP